MLVKSEAHALTRTRACARSLLPRSLSPAHARTRARSHTHTHTHTHTQTHKVLEETQCDAQERKDKTEDRLRTLERNMQEVLNHVFKGRFQLFMQDPRPP